MSHASKWSFWHASAWLRLMLRCRPDRACRNWISLSIVGGALAGALTGCGSDNDAIMAVADSFDPPAGWTVVSDRFEPDRTLCLGDDPCPSVERHWSLGTPLDLDKFTELVNTTNWSPTVIGDCQPLANSYVLHEVCAATADLDGFTATIQQLRTGVDGPTQVILTVVDTEDA